MLNEIAQRKLFTVFLCLRSKSTNMQPVRSAHVVDALDMIKSQSADQLMSLLVQTYVSEFILWVNTTRLNDMKQLSPGNWQKHQAEVVDKIVASVLMGQRPKPSLYGVDWASASAGLHQFDHSKGLDLLFVVDEARSLLGKTDAEGRNLFRYFISFESGNCFARSHTDHILDFVQFKLLLKSRYDMQGTSSEPEGT